MPEHRSEPVRVLHVLSGDLWAGAEVMAHTLIREQTRSPACNVCAAVLNEGLLAEKLRGDGIDTQVVDERQMNAVSIFHALTGLCRAFRPQIVHTHRKKENMLGSLAAWRVGARSIRTVHGWNEFPVLGLNLRQRVLRGLDAASGRYLQDRVVAVSDDLRKRLSGTFDERRLAVIENGIDLEAVCTAGAVPESLPGEPGRKRIGIVGRLVTVKRHDRFLDAAAALLQTGRDDCEFYVAGDGPEIETITEHIGESGHGDRVHLLGFRENILEVIAALDAVVVCSDHEGVPMNVLEAAALGVPIVTLPLPSIVDILDSGARGIVAADHGSEALAVAIRQLLDRGVPPAAPLDDRWPYSSSSMAASYLETYAHVLGG